jgi:type II restriction/modification system DNA methylase subunit YeeA
VSTLFKRDQSPYWYANVEINGVHKRIIIKTTDKRLTIAKLRVIEFALVEQMLAAKAKHAVTTTESEKNRLDIQIEALDRQIDEAVYELYGLTEEEIKIVEGMTDRDKTE